MVEDKNILFLNKAFSILAIILYYYLSDIKVRIKWWLILTV